MLLHKRKILSIGFLGIFIMSLLFSFVAFDFCSARELEISYPNIGVTPPTSTKTFLPDYIQYIFKFSLMLAGIIAFGALVYGGFRYMTSVGSPDAIGEAKKQIMASLVGLTILLCSWLILNTINPELTKFNLEKLTGMQVGVILYEQGGCPGGASPEYIEGKPGEDYLRVRYSMSDLGNMNGKVGSVYRFQGDEDLNVTLYSEPEWEGSVTPVGGGIGCASGGSAQSIELKWLDTGVYLCKTADKHECLLFKESSASLPKNYDDNIKYVYFKQPEDGPKYAAVLHQHPEYRGACHLFHENEGAPNPVKLGLATGSTMNWVSSVTVVKYDESQIASGEKKIIFYRNKDYNKDGCDDPNCKITKCDSHCEELENECKCWGPFQDDISLFKGPAIDENENYGNSIHIDKGLMVILFTEQKFSGNPIASSCQIFFNSDPFLKDDPIAQCKAPGILDTLNPWAPNYGCFKSAILMAITSHE